jgi:hypothetical protein
MICLFCEKETNAEKINEEKTNVWTSQHSQCTPHLECRQRHVLGVLTLRQTLLAGILFGTDLVYLRAMAERVYRAGCLSSAQYHQTVAEAWSEAADQFLKLDLKLDLKLGKLLESDQIVKPGPPGDAAGRADCTGRPLLPSTAPHLRDAAIHLRVDRDSLARLGSADKLGMYDQLVRGGI